MAAQSKKVKSQKESGKKRGLKNAKKNSALTIARGAISNGGIKRLARRAGIKRISSDSFGAIREYYERFLEKLVNGAVNYCDCGHRKIVQPQDVVYALKLQGRNIYGYVYEKKPKTAEMGEDGDKKKE